MEEDKVTIKDEICTVEDSIKVVIDDKEESSENRGIIKYFTNINIYKGSKCSILKYCICIFLEVYPLNIFCSANLEYLRAHESI